jgi:hypothetical protein
MRYPTRGYQTDHHVDHRPAPIPPATPPATHRREKPLPLDKRTYISEPTGSPHSGGRPASARDVSSIFNKLQVADRAEAMPKAQSAGLGDGR